jgi:uncharacterized protein GlcG (DUF336 family)
MPIQKISVSYREATKLLAAIIRRAEQDGGAPVAVAIVDQAARLIAFTAMDGVIPASIKLSQSKAYAAAIGQKDTSHWAQLLKTNPDFDMRNWTDDDFTGFTGGVVILHQDYIIGGIGVSGRKGQMNSDDSSLQDMELAAYGRDYLLNYVENANQETT